MLPQSSSPAQTLGRRRLIAVFTLAVCALLALTTAGSASAAPTTDRATAVAQIKASHDATRSAAHLQPLVESSALDAVAQAWAQVLASRSILVHSDTDPAYNYATHDPSGYRQAAENIGRITSDDTAALYQLWLNSTPHRTTIYTARYDAAGYGVAYSASGEMFAVVEFADYAVVPSPVISASPSSSATATPRPTATATATATSTSVPTSSSTGTRTPLPTPSAPTPPTTAPSIPAPVSSSPGVTSSPTSCLLVVVGRHPSRHTLRVAQSVARNYGGTVVSSRPGFGGRVTSYLHSRSTSCQALVLGGPRAVPEWVVQVLQRLGVPTRRVGSV